MKRAGKYLVAIFFIMTVLLFGVTTVLKAHDNIIDAVKENELSEIPSAVESAMTDNFKSRNNWININGLFQRLVGTTVIRDAGDIDVFRMSNGQLTYEYPDCDMGYAAEEVTGLDQYVRENGGNFLYVQLPCKAYSDDLMPPGTHTYGYKNADEIINSLEENGVSVLDIRKKIEDEDLDIPSLFFNTDHHWRPSTALWTADIISAELANMLDEYNYDASVFDPDNFDRETYEDWFLGSLGRRTGMYFGGTDDYETLIPKYKTKFKLYTEAQNDGHVKKRKGNFSKALMKLKYLDKKDYFSEMTYFTYMGTEYRLATITNEMAPNDKKVLMLRDSFSCPLLPFLSLGVSEITAIDMRYYDTIKIKDYIKDNDFDAVMVVYNPSMFREDGAFDFDR